jgi:hypothetical protein
VSNLQGEMMNIRCDDSAIAPELKTAFREGHKQARHAAAELAGEADAMLALLSDPLTPLRDQFAGQALIGLLSAPATSPHENYLGCAFNGYASADAIASDAYQLADAMLRARAALKGGGNG